MNDTANIYRLPILTTDDPLFAKMARMVRPPKIESDQTVFEPAYASFDVADGSVVDLSYFYQPPSDDPWSKVKGMFDRHLRTEELWVVMDGEFYMPLGLCSDPDDPDEMPKLDEMVCFIIKKGDIFVLKPNVWHCGPWSRHKGKPFSFYMALSGHRTDSSGVNVDYIIKKFPEGTGILPDAEAAELHSK